MEEEKDYNSDSWRTNRVKKREPKFGLYWCEHCDRDLVETGKKCGTCGCRDSDPKREKAGAR